ncbi:MAG: FG-GAP-like repeat-containing protein [Saprospiraceae bacterium]
MIKSFQFKIGLFFFIFFSIIACKPTVDPTTNMVGLLEKTFKKNSVKENFYFPNYALVFYDSLLKINLSFEETMECLFGKGTTLLALGREREAIQAFEMVASKLKDPYGSGTATLMGKLALAYLRMGERQNCINNHTAESCLLPIQGTGIHKDQSGSRTAIKLFTNILDRTPDDYSARWLLNIAYMTVGEYPASVPKKYLIGNLDKDPVAVPFKPFVDIAPFLGLNTKNMAGGLIVDDFNNDNLLDAVTSDWGLTEPMHFFTNDGKGGFNNQSNSSNLGKLTGGLNIMQVDYNNDGYLDIFVLRGGWMEQFGEQPNSLIKNNGDGTFTDVTVQAGLLCYFPTQAAVWRDFNKDGWLDLFIGNETSNQQAIYPSQFFINNTDGTFTESAAKAGCRIIDFTKGVSAGDYDNDGLEDIYISSAAGNQRLFRNTGIKNGIPQFIDVTHQAGLDDIKIKTFPTWFWDYNNDGWLDIFVSGYAFGKSIAHTMCSDALGIPHTGSKMYLYQNNKNGTFTNVSKAAGLDFPVFTMGCNFGDIDNDGYLDMYLATGNPEFEGIVPNKLFRNTGNGSFMDISVVARVANLQKGHAVAIADIDNDGDQDIYVIIGGAYPGDYFHNSLYLNPGQNNNRWLHLLLEGKESNRSALGARIKIVITENGIKRSIYRDVNSGGSFGSTSLRKDIGLGQADVIDELSITWPRTQKTQSFYNVPVNQSIKLIEGQESLIKLELPIQKFIGDSTKIPMCKPANI